MKRSLTKTAIIATFVAQIAIPFSMAHASGLKARDVREKLDKEVRVQVDGLTADRVKVLVDTTKTDLTAAARGQISTRDLESSLKKTFTLNDAGNNVNVNVLELAQSVRKAKSLINDGREINRSELDVEASALIKEIDGAVEVLPKFLSLSSRLSNSTSNEGRGFIKQLSLTKEILSKMSAEEVKSHTEIMNLTVDAIKQAQSQGREMTAEQAYISALKAKFGEKSAVKLEEILGCIR